MTEFQVWLWLSLDSIQTCAQIGGFFIGLVSLLGCITIPIATFEYAIEKKDLKALWLLLLTLIPFMFLLLSLLTTLIPNTKQYAVIKVFPKIVNSDFAKEASSDAKEMYEMAKSYLKDVLKDGKSA